MTDQSVTSYIDLMPKIVDREAKRVQILDAAIGCFARSGYEVTSMDDVAEAAKVSKGSLYDYFENKEDLFYAVFEHFQQSLLKTGVEQTRKQTGARRQLLAFTDVCVGALIEHTSIYPVMLEVFAAAAKVHTRERFSAAMRTLYATYRTQVARIIVQGQKQGEFQRKADPNAIAGILVGAIDGLMLQYWLAPDFDPRGWARNFMNTLLDGLAARTKR